MAQINRVIRELYMFLLPVENYLSSCIKRVMLHHSIVNISAIHRGKRYFPYGIQDYFYSTAYYRSIYLKGDERHAS